MRIEEDTKLDFKDVLIRPKRSTLASRREVNLERTFTFRHSNKQWTGVPIMAANMDGVGTIGMANALQEHSMFTCLVKSYQPEEIMNVAQLLNSNFYAVSTGTSDADFERLRTIIATVNTIKFICVDVANGYSEHFGSYIERVRTEFPWVTIIAGNVVTADMTQELILRGADIVKVGIGPGSVCTTRIQTGVGYPQLSAIMECADAAHGLDGHIIADGGCVCPGDVSKAFGAGADFVMLGGMLAGHDEGGGTMVHTRIKAGEYYQDGDIWEPIYTDKKTVEFYGMSSDTAMEKHYGGVAKYRSSEGRTVSIPYKGAVESTVYDLLGGIRSTCTYVGAQTLKQLPKCTTFIKVNNQFNDVFTRK